MASIGAAVLAVIPTHDMDYAFSLPLPDFTFVAEIDDEGVTTAMGGWVICGMGNIGLDAAGANLCPGVGGDGTGTRYYAY